ncbi:hypothetical protein [Campylobacter sp. 2014D-0216]|uniref:hypothetical protein n=1 Tax=Campylobacter sp. 2014D-0216 TaxID=1813595 RepID=UPI0018A56185|nr:hypothetical protein [Campylobacter sp. 2014D-0216]QOR00779.1 hypothetical protein A0083_05870 [Campylobacter sp. 2014D-0216]
MLIFGHPLISMEKMKRFKGEINQTVVNCFDYDEKIIQLAQEKKCDFAVFVKNEEEVLLSNALGAKYILINDQALAKIASKMAEFYMFDSKILLILDKLENNLKSAYDLSVDGVCLSTYIK